MNSSRGFFKGFLIGLFGFILANALAAHLFSDCGLPAVLGASSCSDDIIRAGFPLVFFEKGGFAFHSNFNAVFLLIDLLAGLGFAVFLGFRMQKRNTL